MLLTCIVYYCVRLHITVYRSIEIKEMNKCLCSLYATRTLMHARTFFFFPPLAHGRPSPGLLDPQMYLSCCCSLSSFTAFFVLSRDEKDEKRGDVVCYWRKCGISLFFLQRQQQNREQAEQTILCLVFLPCFWSTNVHISSASRDRINPISRNTQEK